MLLLESRYPSLVLVSIQLLRLNLYTLHGNKILHKGIVQFNRDRELFLLTWSFSCCYRGRQHNGRTQL
uniref:Uncharacterized protein n=1 Tax=Sinocyclocheilus grahami TaxID=75366 RepID=A0A672L1G6_SINGR